MASNVSLVLWLLVYPTLGLEIQPAETEADKHPECEKLTTSLAVNQQAILQLMRDGSHASSGMAEMEDLREEAAARDVKLQEIEKVIEDITAMIENDVQETLKGVAAQQAALRQEMTSEVNALREEIAALGRLLEKGHEQTPCPDGWLHNESSCYLVDGTDRSWEDSLEYCKGGGGDLAKITSAEEQEFIRAHLSGSRSYYWIGLNARETEGRFVWADGTTPTYTRWREGLPGAGGGWDCVYMYRYHDGKWHDYPCSHTRGVVCERPVHA